MQETGREILVPHNFLTTADRSGVRTEITVGENEMVVLKNIPITIHSDKPTNVILRQYDEKAIEILLSARTTIQVAVRDGDFPVKPGAAYVVKADTLKEVTADKQGRLSFRVALDGQMQIRIEAAN